MRPTVSTLIVAAHVVIVAFAITARFTLARPTSVPPAGNVSTPLYTDGRNDTKAGPLTVSNTLSTTALNVPGTINAQSLCLSNGGCSNTWPNLSRPNWGINDILGAGSTIYNKSIWLRGISLNRILRDSWPTWTGSTYGDTYYHSTSSGFGYCDSTHFMSGVSYCSGGGLCQIICTNLQIQ